MKAMKDLPCVVVSVLLTLALTLPACAADPQTSPDNTWITVSGTVDTVTPNTFTLDYGEGMITVEMDDGDRDADAYKLLKGDKVTVTGIVDDDLYEKRTIEASRVYVEKLNTYFYASPVDEEDTVITISSPVVLAEVSFQGTVTKIVGSEEFKLDTGLREVTVEVDALPYNPLDDVGYPQIEVGDRVRASGRMDYDLFEGRELVADSVIIFRP